MLIMSKYIKVKILFFATLLFSFVTVAPIYIHASAKQTSQNQSPLRMLYPLYNYPQWYNPDNYIWDDIAALGSAVGLVSIVNPNNGPGMGPNADYVVGLNDLINGSEIIGYVTTSYANRPISDVKADIDIWRDAYASWVTGIFFDEVSTDCNDLDYYTQLSQYAQQNGLPTVFLNPGTNTNVCYAQANIGSIVMFEGNKTQWLNYAPPSWMQNYDNSQFASLIYDNDGTTLHDDLVLGYNHNFGFIFVTDDQLPNPWDVLPAYWTQEVAEIVSINTIPIGVFLDSFNAHWLKLIKGLPARVSVDWVTATEIGNAGFNLYRSVAPNTGLVKLNSNQIPSCAPNALYGCAYNYIDSIPSLSRITPIYYYHLESIGLDGVHRMYGPVGTDGSGSY